MPCIIDSSHPNSKSKDSCWKSYCGKTVFFCNNPLRSPKEALESGKAICRACRKAAGLPAKEPVSKKPFEPYMLYRAAMGKIDALQVIGETEVNYRLESGELLRKKNKVEDIYWRRAGSEASDVFFSNDKQEAIAKARIQIQLRRDYLQSLIDEASSLEMQLYS
ncbi:hypothetical protein GCM10007938_42950 [Vibrio zhanjiangensis]|uniref:Uncharacterized protein n=1 Tax=Vibrio zhanjiangensis TaxID=1046128 RepID=A0ABQ6F7C9_9VIBR|nr:hypothetical protein [Vibrio zhanjiangensis]GLT20510.1 hypothetical protein GCM10007938_42950 [Vibrio zhanjiangensis]